MCLKKSIWVFHLLLFSAVASAQNYSAKMSDASKSYWKGYVHPIHTPFSAEASVGTAVYTGELSSPKDGSLQNGYKNLAYGV